MSRLTIAVSYLLSAMMLAQLRTLCAFSVTSRNAVRQSSGICSSVLRNYRLFSVPVDGLDKTELEAAIQAKGDEIRAMKEAGADKAVVAPFIAELLELKAKLNPEVEKPKASSEKKKKQNESKQNEESAESDFITPRAVDYSKWYNDIIKVAGLAENSPVRGCMVIKPWGMSLWDRVRKDLDYRITEIHGAENAYFPLLIPKSFLSKEAEHVDGFAKECAVVTHHRLCTDPKGEQGLIADPEAELEDPLIIRPTSETVIWNTFRKWINSHR